MSPRDSLFLLVFPSLLLLARGGSPLDPGPSGALRDPFLSTCDSVRDSFQESGCCNESVKSYSPLLTNDCDQVVGTGVVTMKHSFLTAPGVLAMLAIAEPPWYFRHISKYWKGAFSHLVQSQYAYYNGTLKICQPDANLTSFGECDQENADDDLIYTTMVEVAPSCEMYISNSYWAGSPTSGFDAYIGVMMQSFSWTTIYPKGVVSGERPCVGVDRYGAEVPVSRSIREWNELAAKYPGVVTIKAYESLSTKSVCPDAAPTVSYPVPTSPEAVARILFPRAAGIDFSSSLSNDSAYALDGSTVRAPGTYPLTGYVVTSEGVEVRFYIFDVIPDEWKSFPGFTVEDGMKMGIVLTSDGKLGCLTYGLEPTPARTEVTLALLSSFGLSDPGAYWKWYGIMWAGATFPYASSLPGTLPALPSP